MSGLRSWRERLATPLPEASKDPWEEKPGDVVRPQTTQTTQTPDSLRVSLRTEESANRTQTQPPVGQRCFVLGCLESLVDIAYCAEHRRMADDGTLWVAYAARETVEATA